MSLHPARVAELLRLAIALRDSEDRCPATGICFHLLEIGTKETDRRAKNYLESLFREWPEFSGTVGFPVPSPRHKLSPWAEFEGVDIYYRTRNKWVGEYGAARLRLLDYIIQRMQEDV